MTNGELLRQLFRGYAKRDDAIFRTAAENIIREERAKNHKLLANDLEAILMNRNGVSSNRPNVPQHDIPRDREKGFPLLDIAEYRYDWGRILLQPKAAEALWQIATEHHRSDILAASGLSPKRKVLFYGPPGCGKTLAAQVLSGVVGYPLVTVRFDAIVSSFLGETAANLRRVFDFVARGQWIVLFDEFDAIGKERDNPFEHGELKRVVNTLIQLMDAFHGESLLIAATNHERLLDEAVWRRFEAVVEFPRPTNQDRVLLLELFLKGFGCSGIDVAKVARRLGRATGADIEWLCVEAARRAVLDSRSRITTKDLEPAITALKDRMRVAEDRIGNRTDTEDDMGEDRAHGE